MPRGPEGRPANERTGREVVDEALAWLAEHRAQRFFLWVHLFEPHAPYGDPGDKRPVVARYDDEVAEADRQVGRLVGSLGADAASTLTVVASDHGEAFGEHGEIGHSIFVYDTTLRVPLMGASKRSSATPSPYRPSASTAGTTMSYRSSQRSSGNAARSRTRDRSVANARGVRNQPA